MQNAPSRADACGWRASAPQIGLPEARSWRVLAAGSIVAGVVVAGVVVAGADVPIDGPPAAGGAGLVSVPTASVALSITVRRVRRGDVASAPVGARARDRSR